MPNWSKKYIPYLKNKEYLFSTAVAVLFLASGIVATYFAILYATDKASAPVTDIILSNLPVFDVDGLFIWGPVVFWIIIGFYIVFIDPKKIPFTIKSIGLFLLIRSFFLVLTHIGPFPTPVRPDTPGLIGVFTSSSDLFFSSHTGLPFLMALIFWNYKRLRVFCFAASLFFGTVVLLGHFHYSIDVFAAFFITYAIFHLAEKFFKKDRLIFNNGLSV